jgi:tRNA(Arg) A34 adenosine deaminase TadA
VPDREYRSDEEKVGFVIDLARTNVDGKAGGPFGAAVFVAGGTHPIAVGVNRVLEGKNALLHAETVALANAHAVLETHDLSGHELFASCEPCAMCLGAVHAAGIDRLVFAALREDVERIGFDEGPVFPESYAYLEDRGLEVVRGLRRADAAALINLYAERGGPAYG